MISDALLSSYAYDNNDPLPEQLRLPLSSILHQLDEQDQACDHDRDRIEDAIEKRQSKIQALGYEIERLRVIQEHCQSAKASIIAKRTQYKATLSAIRRAPPEIITRIMSFVIDEWEGYAGQIARQDFQKLRAVCRLWRQTALSTPYLWHSVSIASKDFPFSQYEDVSPHRKELFAQSLSSWFSRGGEGAPLELCLSCVSVEHATFAFQLVRNLRLNITTTTVFLDSDNFHNGGYYGLKFLEPSSADDSVPLPMKDMVVWFGLPFTSRRTNSRERTNLTHHCAHLAALSLYCDQSLCPTSITHQTLLVLTLQCANLPADDVEFILAGLPLLESLQLLGCTPLQLEQGETTEPVPSYTHSSLKQVEFQFGVPKPFISRLRCPSLNTLITSGDPPPGSNSEQQLVCLEQFTKRCGVSIPFTFYGEVRRAPRRILGRRS
ncbi:hypothetical protein BKA70DRAFT_1450291 [Coprinopsis sp. MPI-PUGE-AT-0042]|nr:hypothetical protein BKA70DRAFT_1450291 [Coprinopsis sp. MPI-PUGE-AT-0042]